MKTKNLALGLFALLLAGGSAFASLLITDVPIYVKVKQTELGPIECISAQAQCDDQGSQACTIQVASAQVGSNQTTNAYIDDNCQTRMEKDGQALEQSPLNVYQLF